MHLPTAVAHLIEKLEGWGQSLFLLLPNILLALVTLILFWFLAKLIDYILRRAMHRFDIGHEVIDLTGILVFLVIVATGIFIALDAVGLNKAIASLLAGVGILALAVGLALRSTGENYIAGIYLSIQRPFRVGQVIESRDYFGVVERITLRSTWLRVTEGQLVHLPNKNVFENAIVNYSDGGLRRVDIKGHIAYTAELERAREIAIEAISAMENRISEKDVEFFYFDFEDSWIKFELRFWIDFTNQVGYRAARSEAIVRLKRAFEENGVVMPYPTRTLDFTRGLADGTLETQLRRVNEARAGGESDGRRGRH